MNSGKAAIKDTDLLLKVARHKEVFFPAAWARYADAKPGTLRLVPPDARLTGVGAGLPQNAGDDLRRTADIRALARSAAGNRTPSEWGMTSWQRHSPGLTTMRRIGIG